MVHLRGPEKLGLGPEEHRRGTTQSFQARGRPKLMLLETLEAVAILVIYVFDVLIADYARCSRW